MNNQRARFFMISCSDMRGNQPQ